MPGHYGSHAGIDSRAKRNEFDGVEPFAGHVDFRQPTMRIDSRISMSGKMLRRSDHARMLRAFYERSDKSRHVDGIFTVRAHINDRIRRIVRSEERRVGEGVRRVR